MVTTPGSSFARQPERSEFARELQQFVDTPRAPGRSHLRTQAQELRMVAPPGAPFRRKLAAFLTTQLWGWVGSYLKFRFGPRHVFQTYTKTNETGIYPLAGISVFSGAADPGEEVRISLAGDWATGTLESHLIAELMGPSARFKPHYTIHLGDVYYVGDTVELEQNCLGERDQDSGAQGVKWPIGSVGAFALNGNHEMYANGNAYFDSFLPRLGVRPNPEAAPAEQKASYFCLQNEWWTVIGLDTGYNSVGLPLIEKIPGLGPSCKQRPELIDWLINVVKLKTLKGGLVILSHHQYYSAFDEMFAKPAQQMAELTNGPVLWFWGHEHRLAIYGKHSMKNGIEAYGRCVGHGGMPVDINMKIKRNEFPLVLYDDRVYDTLDGDKQVGFNGIANLTFKGNELVVDYRDIKDNQLLTENWQVTNGTLTGKSIQRVDKNPNIKEVASLGIAIGQSG